MDSALLNGIMKNLPLLTAFVGDREACVHLAQIVRGYSKARTLVPFSVLFPVHNRYTNFSQAAMLTWQLTALDRAEEQTIVMRDGRIYPSYSIWDLSLFVSSGDADYGSIYPRVNAITVRDAPHVFLGSGSPASRAAAAACDLIVHYSKSTGIKATTLLLYLLAITLCSRLSYLTSDYPVDSWHRQSPLQSGMIRIFGESIVYYISRKTYQAEVGLGGHLLSMIYFLFFRRFIKEAQSNDDASKGATPASKASFQ